MRGLLIRTLLPLCFCLVPLLAAALVAVAIPRDATAFFIVNIGAMDSLILGLGALLFALQMPLCWRALRWRGTGFDESADRWVNHLAQAAEWFPLLGLLGTVGGILQTFSSITPRIEPHEIIQKYAPAITATGAGLFMAFVNILPPWMVILGRELIVALGGGQPAQPLAAQSMAAQPAAGDAR
ncbi:MAG: MotA/TolQ/ExbB proton channel family protein [Gemmataceae bacterium]|nr:MotA/TolQ/ExbB proton channel family protein [Gemmataceae bacterium]